MMDLAQILKIQRFRGRFPAQRSPSHRGILIGRLVRVVGIAQPRPRSSRYRTPVGRAATLRRCISARPLLVLFQLCLHLYSLDVDRTDAVDDRTGNLRSHHGLSLELGTRRPEV